MTNVFITIKVNCMLFIKKIIEDVIEETLVKAVISERNR